MWAGESALTVKCLLCVHEGTLAHVCKPIIHGEVATGGPEYILVEVILPVSQPGLLWEDIFESTLEN